MFFVHLRNTSFYFNIFYTTEEQTVSAIRCCQLFMLEWINSLRFHRSHFTFWVESKLLDKKCRLNLCFKSNNNKNLKTILTKTRIFPWLMREYLTLDDQLHFVTSCPEYPREIWGVCKCITEKTEIIVFSPSPNDTRNFDTVFRKLWTIIFKN